MFTDVSEELVAFFFMVWVVKETVHAVKIETIAPQKSRQLLTKL
jgi:hypothetical protein